MSGGAPWVGLNEAQVHRNMVPHAPCRAPEVAGSAHAEALELYIAQGDPDFDTVVKMRTLLLFQPSSFVVRETFRDMELDGKLRTPKGTYLFVSFSTRHHDATVWGHTMHRFDPGMFHDGVAAACNPPQAFMSFGLGARTCLIEVKALVALFLIIFSLVLSPDYRNAPAFWFIIETEFIMRLLVCRLGH